MQRYEIRDLNNKLIGVVIAPNKGAALQAAVDNNMVTGRKKIKSAKALPHEDPYEQSIEDIYGSSCP